MVVFCVCGYCLVVSRGNLMVGVGSVYCVVVSRRN
jgi:hypothetical protein